MRTTIDHGGRVVVPKQLRDRLHLVAGSAVEVEERDGTIEIRPASAEVHVLVTKEGPVATKTSEGAELTDADVRQTLEHLRRP